MRARTLDGSRGVRMTITNRPHRKAQQQTSRRGRTRFRHREWWIDGLVESIIRGKKLRLRTKIGKGGVGFYKQVTPNGVAAGEAPLRQPGLRPNPGRYGALTGFSDRSTGNPKKHNLGSPSLLTHPPKQG